jgi:GxxExxY protein
VQYKAPSVGRARLDYLVDESLVVELKACECIAPIHIAQTLSYLKATRIRVALLISFNVPVTSAWDKTYHSFPMKLGELGVLAVEIPFVIGRFRGGR